MHNARLLAFLVAALVAGCAGGGAATKEPTRLDVTVVATASVNPDEKGRAAPIQVRIYELKSEAAFEAADYFSLASGDKALLQADLLARDEYLLRPGDTRRIQRKSNPETVAIGVVAGFRDLPANQWRAVHKLAEPPEASMLRAVLPANKARLKVTLEPGGVRIQPVD